MSEPLWYRDRKALALVACRYLPWLAAVNLVWEIAQLPLYTIWTDGTRAEIAFAIFHCTLGDILIGTAALALVLTLTRARVIENWRWGRTALLLMLFGTAFTLFSEWANTTLLRWTYSALMPTVNLAGVEIGLSPLTQWLVVPPLALWRASRAIPRAG